MCEYTFENGEKCRIKAISGSKYCSLHIPFEEGELLYGEKIKEIKERAFKRKLERGVRHFEGIQLYEARISNLTSKKPLVFKNSKIKTLIVESSHLKGITLYKCEIERVIILSSTIGTLWIKGSTFFGFNLLDVKFGNSIYIRESIVRYIMMNSVQHVEGMKPHEEEYGEKEAVYGRIELSELKKVRRIGINSRYPLLKDVLEEHGINFSGISRKHVKAKIFIIKNIEFDPSPRFKRQVRVFIRNLDSILQLENLEIPRHVEIRGGRLRIPEFIHTTVQNNLVFRNVTFHGDITWNLTVLPNLPAELTVKGFVILEKCRFNNPTMEEFFYRLARISWEKSGDKEKADMYYYLEMLARRKQKMGRYITYLPKLGIGVKLPSLPFRKVQVKAKHYIHLLEGVFEWFFADLTCKYGTDWKRPILIWIFMVNIIFPSLFYFTKSVTSFGVPLESFWDYEYFSIVTATTLGYGDLHPIGIGRIFASLEALFGMFMWAVFLTVFARKYMR
ncbi:potassium transporter Kef [Thermococcus sp. EP1]|uniref:potassium channel family protein n=1 Tax=Thermococcus sp. EP1 TaxID=1591054 RepID=UPI0006DB7BE0|nr:potassium channel family protein [Thermococcus sp. EP1]KPU62493.1 potassium transporter Kef [Thermococcus sp. EP1]